jgi:hypothetical protein
MDHQSDYGCTTGQQHCLVCHSGHYTCLCESQPRFSVVDESHIDQPRRATTAASNSVRMGVLLWHGMVANGRASP